QRTVDHPAGRDVNYARRSGGGLIMQAIAMKNILLRLATLALGAIILQALTPAVWASGFFGTVVPIGGHASDIALDEGRGVLYIANYAANRIEVMNTSDRSIGTSINVPLPGSLAMSRDGKYLVVGTYANF